MDGINATAFNRIENWDRDRFTPDVILRRAKAVRGTVRPASSGNSADGNSDDVSSSSSPVHSTEAFGSRKVPHAGFAAVQDDKILRSSGWPY